MPAEPAKLAGVFQIIGDVALKLFLPPFGAGLRGGGSFAAFMPVPEAAMNKNDGFIFRQDDVRFAGKVFHIFSKPVARAVQHGADKNFRFRIFALNLPHIP